MKTLEAIIHFFQKLSESAEQAVVPSGHNPKLKWLINDSRECSEKSVFVAQQGLHHHGLDFLTQVLESGCRVIISDRPVKMHEQALLDQILDNASPVQLIVIDNLNQILPKFCHWFYDFPTQKLKVIGITGTNGKTSTAFYCAQLLEAKGDKVAVIGTLGNGSIHQLKATQNTTPDIIRLTTLLAGFVEANYEWVVMEVSSHAIALGRITGFEFYTAAITQIGSDHLDFHQTQIDYEQTKLRLFTDYSAKHHVFNLSDKTVLKFVEDQNQSVFKKLRFEKILGYCLPDDCYTDNNCEKLLPDSISLLQAKAAEFYSDGLGFKLLNNESISPEHQKTECHYQSALLGRFNIENLMCAISVVNTCGVDLKTLQADVAKLSAVPGRMQIVHHHPTVIIDFAHTADALQNLLEAVKVHLNPEEQQHSLGLVFGCGGDRDRQKRPEMAKVAQEYADRIMVTSDNPRKESPQKIIDEILQGFSENTVVMVEADRMAAIEQMLAQAASEDLIVVAGKGHEDYQEIQGVKYPFSDHAVIEQYFERRQING